MNCRLFRDPHLPPQYEHEETDMEQRHSPKIEMDDNLRSTLQELLTAIGDLPGVMDKIDAYLRGRGVDDPQEEIRALRKIAF